MDRSPVLVTLPEPVPKTGLSDRAFRHLSDPESSTVPLFLFSSLNHGVCCETMLCPRLSSSLCSLFRFLQFRCGTDRRDGCTSKDGRKRLARGNTVEVLRPTRMALFNRPTNRSGPEVGKQIPPSVDCRPLLACLVVWQVSLITPFSCSSPLEVFNSDDHRGITSLQRLQCPGML